MKIPSHNRNYGKWFLTKVKKAVKDYNMIENGDKIAVGISGGKDSMGLLFILDLLKKSSSLTYDIVAITIDLGWNMDFSPIEVFCKKLGIPYIVENTLIGKIVFDVKNESNPCSLCAKMRRGALDNVAKDMGCNKVALGHHGDDAIETMFLNMIFAGRLSAFEPKSYLSRKDLTLIRPLIYLKEQTVSSIVNTCEIPIVENLCPASDKTKRNDMKKLVDETEKIFKNSRSNMIEALKRVDFFMS